VFWREGEHRCELWIAVGIRELRIYVSDKLFSKEKARCDIYDRTSCL
jgi:hypothetical protein